MDTNTVFTFAMLAILMALFSVVAFSVVRTATRRKRSVFGKGTKSRVAIYTVLVLSSCFFLFQTVSAVRHGQIHIVLGSHLTSSTVAYTLYRAANPSGFWEAVCIYSYLGLMLLYVCAAEIIRTIKRVRN